jgi:hypothetical protein
LKLKEEWSRELDVFKHRDLSAREYAYLWADGSYFTIRLDNDDRHCILVLIGANKMVARSSSLSRTVPAARTAVFEHIEVVFNRKRLQSALGYQSRSAYEACRLTQQRRLLPPNKSVGQTGACHSVR